MWKYIFTGVIISVVSAGTIAVNKDWIIEKIKKIDWEKVKKNFTSLPPNESFFSQNYKDSVKTFENWSKISDQFRENSWKTQNNFLNNQRLENQLSQIRNNGYIARTRGF